MSDKLFDGFWDKDSWIEPESPKATSAILLLAGVLGGALAPAAASFAGVDTKYTFVSVFQNIGLGFAAAGIGTLVVADTRRKDWLTLFFFALLCAISFPSVLQKAMADLSVERAEDIALEADTNDASELQSVATELKTTNRESLPTKTAMGLEASLLKGVRASAETGRAGGEADQRAAIDALASVSEAAEQAGFSEVARVADEQARTVQNAPLETGADVVGDSEPDAE